MKKQLLILLLFTYYIGLGQIWNSNSIIGKTINIGPFVVAEHDFPVMMTWGDAILACNKLGNGWRLPTKDELNVLYENKQKIGNFMNYGYWSSNEGGWRSDILLFEAGWTQYFYDGDHFLPNKGTKNYVRAIRQESTLKSDVNIISNSSSTVFLSTFLTSLQDYTDSNSIIGNPIKIGNLLVSENSFDYNNMDVTWNLVNAVCKNLGNGWRLPTKDELNILFKNNRKLLPKNSINIQWRGESFWSSSEIDYDEVWVQNLYTGKKYIASKHNSRGPTAILVKTINN